LLAGWVPVHETVVRSITKHLNNNDGLLT